MNAAYSQARRWVGDRPHAEQGVQERGRIVAAEQGAVHRGQLAVEEVSRAQYGQQALEVPIGQVAHVEAQERTAGRRHPLPCPASAANLAHRGARRPPGAGHASGFDRDVQADEQRGGGADQDEVSGGDVVGVAKADVGGIRGDQRRDEHGERDRRRRRDLPPPRRRRRAESGGRLFRPRWMDPAQSRDAGGGQLRVRIGVHATRHIYRVPRFDPAADAVIPGAR